MRSKEEIEKRRDMFEVLAQETQSKIDDFDIKIKKSQSSYEATYLKKQKESLNILLAITNSQWVELMWVLEE